MRKRYRVLALAAVVIGLAVPLGFALVPGTSASTPVDRRDVGIVATVTIPQPLLPMSSTPSIPLVHQLHESVKLMLVGTLLITAAAIARRA
ncbi:MAG TPA: hypothetical protein VH583_23025 [Vicinamibacterales bacterium]|jgi:hypothetical protein